ncbi:hypothetical protein A2Z33_07405 [Candidatus Gottesmanbacteria bacterium RBG_16_52_11]|uniref:Aminotransferase class I/classII large domain-containing protein n=1 Tax=Candidatus Gottesmanbacteria bacterium RBG_16_52_11 TaxID=1798374 RepID=A0A1F5YY07_9BACT|nr:MAG: hypothetical protein A2Z33_07405 [Candidatus Gottesmanbacteria bacterium RBG_16_52_11]
MPPAPEADPALTGRTAGMPESAEVHMKNSAAIRSGFVSKYREMLGSGEIKNGIRALAIMARECCAAGGEVINLTIGDVDWRSFKDLNPSLADKLGLDPEGHTRQEMDSFIRDLRITHASPEEESLWSYQPEAIGYLPLREEFAGFLSGFGLMYTSADTVLSSGSLPGLDSLLGTIAHMANSDGTKTDFLFPVPAFSVIRAQAKRRGISITEIPADSGRGYCPSAQDVRNTLGPVKQDYTVFYLTPMNNPTSTVYDPETLSETLTAFHKLRPNGYVIIDLAYIEMIDSGKAREIASVIRESPLSDKAVISVSMSKLFGDPRLRMAALLTKDRRTVKELTSQWQTVFASLPGNSELEALAKWKYVSAETRRLLYSEFRRRQDEVLRMLKSVNEKRISSGAQPLIDLDGVCREIPMYLYLRLTGGDMFDLFSETGILGVPGEIFGDTPDHNMVRIAVGMIEIPSFRKKS